MLGGPGIASVLKARQGSLTFTWNENSGGGGGGVKAIMHCAKNKYLNF